MLKQAGQYIIPPQPSKEAKKSILIQPVQIAFQGREGEKFSITYSTTEPDKNNTPIDTGLLTSDFIFGKTGVIQYDNMGENRIYSITNHSDKSSIIVDYVENVNMIGGGAGSEDENGSKENPYFNYYASVMVGGPNHVHGKEDEIKGGVINE